MVAVRATVGERPTGPDVSGDPKPHVLVLVERPLDRRDYDRLGIAYMVERGNRVTVFDVGDITFPGHGGDRSHYVEMTDIRAHHLHDLSLIHI